MEKFLDTIDPYARLVLSGGVICIVWLLQRIYGQLIELNRNLAIQKAELAAHIDQDNERHEGIRQEFARLWDFVTTKRH